MDLPTLASKALKVMLKYEQDFETIEDLAEQLRYVEKKLAENEIYLKETIKLWKRNASLECDCTRSKELREQGNKFYRKKRIFSRY